MSAEQLAQAVTDGAFQLAQWRVDPELNQISRPEEIVRLEPRTMRLLVRLFSGASPMRNRGLVLTYAHLLLLAGETRRGRELLTSLLEHLDAKQIGRPAHMYAWERASALAMLGEDERALAELATSQKMGRFAGWWYTAELDPVYSRVRNDARFQALAARARAHSQQQRARLDEMRRNGEVPKRT